MGGYNQLWSPSKSKVYQRTNPNTPAIVLSIVTTVHGLVSIMAMCTYKQLCIASVHIESLDDYERLYNANACSHI